MYIIVVYDVEEKRVNKVKKFLRVYLSWVQNSVLEGELTESQFFRMKNGLREIINEQKDSVKIYILNDRRLVKKEILGVLKGDSDIFIL